MLKRNTGLLVGGLSLFVLLAVGMLAMQINCPPISAGPVAASKACAGFALFKEMQTLLTGLLALAAAVIAVRPVYLQLEKMRVQTDVAARDIIAKRTEAIKNRAAVDLKRVRDVSDEFARDMDYDQTAFNHPLRVDWLMHREPQIQEACNGLTISNSERLGTSLVEIDREALFDAVDAFRCGVRTITAPEWMDMYEDCTDDEFAEARLKAVEVEPLLYEKWLAMNVAMRKFDETTKSEVDRLKRRVRQIDDSVVEGDI